MSEIDIKDVRVAAVKVNNCYECPQHEPIGGNDTCMIHGGRLTPKSGIPEWRPMESE